MIRCRRVDFQKMQRRNSRRVDVVVLSLDFAHLRAPSLRRASCALKLRGRDESFDD